MIEAIEAIYYVHVDGIQRLPIVGETATHYLTPHYLTPLCPQVPKDEDGTTYFTNKRQALLAYQEDLEDRIQALAWELEWVEDELEEEEEEEETDEGVLV